MDELSYYKQLSELQAEQIKLQKEERIVKDSLISELKELIKLLKEHILILKEK